jgi:hypothetical protein
MSPRSTATALIAGLALLFAVAPPQPVAAIVGYCGTAYVVLYDGDTRSTANRQYCYGISDSDIETEPGNVMGPLGDGSPVVYKDDFNAANSASGVNSLYFYNGSGATRVVCAYTGTGYSGTLSVFGPLAANTSFYFTDIGPQETYMGSVRIVSASTCPPPA